MSDALKAGLWIVLAVLLWSVWQDYRPSGTTEATAAVYVHESKEHVVPPEVRAALRELQSDSFDAAEIDDDNPSTRYKTAIAAAKQHGLPALVVMAGEKVVRVVAVRTAEEVKEAVK